MHDDRSLIAWQRAREIVLALSRRRDSLWRRNTSAMLDQLQRSALLDLSEPGDRLLDVRAKSIEVQAMVLALLRNARKGEQVRSKK